MKTALDPARMIPFTATLQLVIIQINLKVWKFSFPTTNLGMRIFRIFQVPLVVEINSHWVRPTVGKNLSISLIRRLEYDLPRHCFCHLGFFLLV